MRGWDETGQANIDFLFGFGIFLLTFVYAATFIPGLFSLYQPANIDLNSVAYRTGAMLAEDPGWYNYTIGGKLMGDTAWEEHPDQLSRVGLAADRERPNVLSLDKIEELDKLVASNYTLAREKMGLNGSIVYDISLSIKMHNMTGDYELIQANWPAYRPSNVEHIERDVLVEAGKELFIDTGVGHSDSVQRVCLANMTPDYKKDIVIRVFNVTGPVTHVYWSQEDIVSPTWVYGVDYSFYKNGALAGAPPVSLAPGDTLEIFIKNSALVYDADGNLQSRYVWIYGYGSMFPGGIIDYFDDPAFKLRGVCYPATMSMEVWSYAFA